MSAETLIESNPRHSAQVICLYRGINAMTSLGLSLSFPNNWIEIVFCLLVMILQVCVPDPSASQLSPHTQTCRARFYREQPAWPLLHCAHYVTKLLGRLCQVWLSGLILGTLFHYLGQKDIVSETHKQLLEDLSAFCDQKLLPPEMRERIIKVKKAP